MRTKVQVVAAEEAVFAAIMCYWADILAAAAAFAKHSVRATSGAALGCCGTATPGDSGSKISCISRGGKVFGVTTKLFGKDTFTASIKANSPLRFH